MKRSLKAIARALIAIPVLTWTVCAATGRMLLSAVLPPQPQMTTAAGEQADVAIEAAQARPMRSVAETAPEAAAQAKLALTFAAALVTGSRPPDLSGQPDSFRHWLADLTPEGARRLFKVSVGQIERHLNPRAPGDHLEGVPSIGVRPLSAAPVIDGSKMHLEALAKAPKPEMTSDGEFRIFHDAPGEDQSTRLRAA
jgi:hypothetical protein